MSSNKFAPWPNFSQKEIDAVAAVLSSGKVNYWTGDEGRKFEAEFASFAGAEFAIALANGTVALDLALYALGIGANYGGSADDEVIVTPRSFMASVSSIVNAGARPIFADVDRVSQNITPETVEPLISTKTRAIVCVHLAGWPCDMDGFRELIGNRSISLIEDCAQAHGALYKGRPVGSLGDIAAWSFCQDKIMTTGGEGGMVTCNSRSLWQKMWEYKDHGKSWDAVYNKQHPPGFRWLHESFGTNWRLTEMQSAIGRVQLQLMPQWHAERMTNAHRLASLLSDFTGPDGPMELVLGTPEIEHAFYKLYAFVRTENLPQGETRDSLVAYFNDRGLPCFQGSCSEIYLEKAFDNTGLRPAERLPVARKLGETSLMFLVHPGASYENIEVHWPR